MNTKKRIGFIAMSGVRAHNAELTQLGLTLPGFVDRNKIIASLPSLGLLTLAGLTPDKFEISYHEIADLKTLPGAAGGFRSRRHQHLHRAILRGVRRRGFLPRQKNSRRHGRHHRFVRCAKQAKEHCTSVVIGEGELLWPELLADFERGALKPFYAAGEGI